MHSFLFTVVYFRDMWPLLQKPEVFEDCVSLMTSYIQTHCGTVDVIVGLEARGFIFGPMIAQKLNVAFVPIRKKGKLPGETNRITYKLEYGEVSCDYSSIGVVLRICMVGVGG